MKKILVQMNVVIFINLPQVSLVVKELGITGRIYVNKYVGFWKTYEFNKDAAEDMNVGDKRMDSAMHLALANSGNIQRELLLII